MQSIRGILNFVRTAELGSFAKASKELGISAVAVSQNISRLEQQLGVRLLARTTRALSLTPEGSAFLEQCRGPLGELEAACSEVSEGAQQASGKVRVTLVSPVAHLYVVPFLPLFFAQYPDIELDLELSEEVNPLISRSFDVGIRAGALQDAAYVARPLGPLKLLMCASPAYLAQRGVPASLEALHQHSLLQLHLSGQERPLPWAVQVRNGAARTAQMLQLPARLHCNDFRSLLDCCIAGLGIAHLPQPLALAALQKGQLKLVLADNILEGLQLFVHYPSRKQLPQRVRAFVDFVLQGLGGHPDLTADVSGYGAVGVNKHQNGHQPL